ncbi:uncharacterized protein PITG_09998 [Phytophthora infestans T30-4]|uniref:Transmembrane protein n=2 Tax=Phytophthora infestans TaxID=4787 RepID=D0NE15_PHYIT|nr:uncharacterized protein PITG_09998 [Phytophthora infestans T30-4]AAN31497.1 unknown [Phytophthora infestans]EEY56460.1 conserved hypothetical protein [Phytophthora infestans T30-4]KAF4040806.1 hypothetical protein GN244_ATG06848 [Phytophthora infestans]KAF4145175.1 hypothetical protein GN958_ATG05647 [Phytophthora infestans]KAI9993278.1 hypothetical protein PInf_015356 [Phytophthora infestans]|eukprot:XP_002902534.1 conserved hypothetical protein [Phytophthora infestans T30-4]
MHRGVLRSLVLLALLATVASSQSSSGSTSTSIFTNSTTNSSSSSSSSKSQCEICRDGGDCSKAYNGAAGKFCNSWLDRSSNRRACCCPASDVCSSDNTYECTCQLKKNERPSYWIWIGLGVFAVGGLIGASALMAIRKRRTQQQGAYRPEAGMAYPQQPVYAQGGYPQQGYAPGSYEQPVYAQGGYAQPTYVQPGYGPGGYRDDYGRGGRRGMGTGGAVAMGAAGGLLGGLLIGEALGDMGGDGGGGGEFGGDF